MQNTLHGNPYFLFPDLLKRWYFWKNRAGIWSFLYYRGRWYFFFPKIWSYTQTENERWLSQKKIKKNTRKYIFFKCPEKMVFSKRTAPGYDFSCTFGKGGIFPPKKWYFFPGRKTRERGRRPSSRNTRKHGIFYLICSMPPLPKKIKDDPIPQKYT